MNILEERADDFVTVNYGELLTQLIAVLDRDNIPLFRVLGDGHYLQIDADGVAQQVAERAARLRSLLGAAGNDARVASTHFGDTYPNFVQQVRQLGERIEMLLAQAIAASPATATLDSAAFVASLCTPLRHLNGTAQRFGLEYPFDRPYTDLKKLRLSLRPDTVAKPALRLHRVSITVDHPDQFAAHLESGLRRHADVLLDQSQDEQIDRDELEAIIAEQLADRTSDFHRLRYLVNIESLGKIRREAQVRYLEFLRNGLGQGEGASLLDDLIRRLRLIDTYLAEYVPDDAHYQVSYAGSRPLNYRDLFSRGDAFDPLPIIPLLEGALGETTDPVRGHRTFLFGVKLKLGGRVNTLGPHAPHVFDYVLDEYLLPDGQRHQDRLRDSLRSEGFKARTLRVALLYFFALREFGNRAFDPVAPFEEHILPVLRGDDETAKRTLLSNIRTSLKRDTDAQKRSLPARLQLLRNELRTTLKTRRDFPQQRYPFHLLVKRGVLEQSLGAAVNRRSLLKPIFGETSKEGLRYLTVGAPHIDATALCKLSGMLTIDNTHFYVTNDEQQFSMGYAIDDIAALPVLMAPKLGVRSVRNAFSTFFADYRQILLPYHATYLSEGTKPPLPKEEAKPPSPAEAFCYRFTFALLSYLSLHVIAAHARDPLFLPLVRFHLDSEQEPTEQGTFLRGVAKVITHLLNETHRASTQGFDVRLLTTLPNADKQSITPPAEFAYRIKNGLSSLYAALPKRFQFTERVPGQHLDRLAIIIVSSRECDVKRGGSHKKANLMGEIVGMERQPDGAILVAARQTFSDVYRQEKMHTEPTVLIDVVGRMYEEGYRHFIYIARSPYSSTLHMTDLQNDTDLFFMSRSVIQALKSGRPDLKLYPVFFDKYPVVRMQPGKPQSLYIQDTLELTQLMEDPSKRTVMFFNLFNGKVITLKDDPDGRFYNGVIAYSTLLNVYNDILDDRDIYVGLLNDGDHPSLKDELLTYLTLFHFARYEGAARDGGIVLKLDPYQHLIGDDSVGRLSIMRHVTGRADFNIMAFLTEVRKVLGGMVVVPAKG